MTRFRNLFRYEDAKLLITLLLYLEGQKKLKICHRIIVHLLFWLKEFIIPFYKQGTFFNRRPRKLFLHIIVYTNSSHGWHNGLLSLPSFFAPRSLADPGKARGCSTNSLLIKSVSEWVSQPFPPTALQHRHAQKVRDCTSSYKQACCAGCRRRHSPAEAPPIGKIHSFSKMSVIFTNSALWAELV